MVEIFVNILPGLHPAVVGVFFFFNFIIYFW